MKLELKNVKYADFASEETACFSAAVYADGVKVASVGNDGRGGSDNVWWRDKAAKERVEAYLATLPPEIGSFNDPKTGKPYVHLADLESEVAKLLDAYLTNKQYKRWCKTKVVFRLKTDKPGEFRTLKGAFAPHIAEHLRKKYGDQLDVIINEQLAKESA